MNEWMEETDGGWVACGCGCIRNMNDNWRDEGIGETSRRHLSS